MAFTLTRGITFGVAEQITNAKLHNLIDLSVVTEIAPGDTSTINPTNLLSNGDFECWSAGVDAAPDGWTLGGAGASIERDYSGVKIGTYFAGLIRAGTNCYLSQYIHAGKGIAYWKGRTVTYGCWVYATVANRARIEISDGVDGTYSSYHTGGSTWEYLTVMHTVEATATELQCLNWVEKGDTTTYFDGAMCVEGASAFAFADKPAGEGVWSDYFATSTITGWAAGKTGTIYVKKIGKTVFVNFYITGTSNATSAIFTVPYTSTNVVHGGVLFSAQDNGTAIDKTCQIIMSGSSDTIYCSPDLLQSAWTASGTKVVYGQFWYEEA